MLLILNGFVATTRSKRTWERKETKERYHLSKDRCMATIAPHWGKQTRITYEELAAKLTGEQDE